MVWGYAACDAIEPVGSKHLKKFITFAYAVDIEIHNRIRIGFAIGWQYYASDEDHNFSEVTIFLGLISMIIKY